MQFKHHFRARRPADRSVLVQPMLITPGHGSYPAGHATQCFFASYVIAKLVGSYTNGVSTTSGPTPNDLPNQLDALAARIAHNRVVAGLHYLQDNDAGKGLGQDLGKYFIDRASAKDSAIAWLWDRAAKEWVLPP